MNQPFVLRLYRRGNICGCAVFGNVSDGLSIYLNVRGCIELNAYFVTVVNSNPVLLFYMLTLEDGGEGGKNAKATFSVEEHDRELAVGRVSILLGRGHHTAAVVASLHGGSYPNLLVAVFFSVNRNYGIRGLVMEEQPLDGDRRVVDGSAARCLDVVALGTAVAVKTKAYVVDKSVGFAVDLD